jgi:hypothetical protein
LTSDHRFARLRQSRSEALQSLRPKPDHAVSDHAYELLTRRSELVALTTNDLETLDDGTMRVIIRRSKADPFGYLEMAEHNVWA